MTIKNGYVQDWSTISSRVIKVYFMCCKSHESYEVCVPSSRLKPCGLSDCPLWWERLIYLFYKSLAYFIRNADKDFELNTFANIHIFTQSPLFKNYSIKMILSHILSVLKKQSTLYFMVHLRSKIELEVHGAVSVIKYDSFSLTM